MTPQVVVPGSVVDVTINIAGPSSANAGDNFTYTVTMSNNLLPDADGTAFTISMPTGATGVSASCSVTAGATCPGVMTVTNSSVAGATGLLPHLGVVTLTITGRFGVPSPTTVTATATVSPPAGTTDSDPTSDSSTVSTAMNIVADTYVTKTQSSGTISPSSPITYTVTFGNLGPAAADGATVQDLIRQDTSLFSTVQVHVNSCVATGGVACPAQAIDRVLSANDTLLNTTIGVFPAGSSFTLSYTVTPALSASPGCGQATTTFRNSAQVNPRSGVTDPSYGNNQTLVDATSPGPGPCPTADVGVTKSQSASTIAPGSPVTYTVTWTNSGPNAADGASISDLIRSDTSLFSRFDYTVVSCTATGGAVCPTPPPSGSYSTNFSIFSSTRVSTFPVGSSFTLVYTIDPVLSATPGCGPTTTSITNDVSVNPPSGVSDPNYSNNSLRTTATAAGPGACPPADVSVTKTQSSNVLMPGAPITYTMTVANAGPADASGTTITDFLRLGPTPFIFAPLNYHVVSCTTTGGATCPTPRPDGSIGTYDYIYSNSSITSLPAGSSFTLTYTISPVPAAIAGCAAAVYTTENLASLNLRSGLTDPNYGNNSLSLTASTNCADIAVNKTVAPASAQAGHPVTYSIVVANSSTGAANGVVFSDPLPTGFVFTSASCAPKTAASTCGTVNYDPGTRTVSSVITRVGPNQDNVTFTINGTAGTIPGTYQNTATATPPGSGPNAFIDPNPNSNSTTVSLQVFNTSSTITVTKSLTGLRAGGVPVPLTFTGEIDCAGQPPHTWSVTIAAGAASSAAAPATFFDGVACTITENPPPPLPPGWTYAGGAAITPSTIASLGPSADVQVSSVTPLMATAILQLHKSVDRTTATVGDVLTYSYQVTNGGIVDIADLDIREIAFSGSGTHPVPSCPSTSLPASGTIICTATYTVTAADLAAGSVTNTADATGTPEVGPIPVAAPSSASATIVPPPAITLEKVANPTTITAAGQSIDFTYTVTNTGGVPLSGIAVGELSFNGDLPLTPATCTASTLAPGASTVCTTTYTVSQADFESATALVNTAVASGTAPAGFTSPTSAPATATVTLETSPALTLVKSAQLADGSNQLRDVGQVVDYSYVVTNTGDVSLSGITIIETAFSGSGTVPTPTCPQTTLAPGAQMRCTASYSVVTADILRGSVTNTATATGIPLSGTPVTSQSSAAAVPQAPAPALELVKTVSPSTDVVAGDELTYTFTVRNTGNVDLTGIRIDETLFAGSGTLGFTNCPQTPEVAPGQIVTCTMQYTATAEDAAAGTISNTAVAAALLTDRSAAPPSNESTATATFAPLVAPGALEVTKTAAPVDANGNGIVDVGDTGHWRIHVTNSGGLPVTDIVVVDPTAVSATCPGTTLDPGASMDCTADTGPIDVPGTITNTASATGTTDGSAITSNPSTASIVALPARTPTPGPTPSPTGESALATTGGAVRPDALVLAVCVIAFGGGIVAFRRRARRE